MPGGKFTDSLITENLKVATEYFKLTVAKIQNDALGKIKNSGGSIGFIPFKINFTMDGLSGIKIYNELVLDTSFLPIGYSKTLKFIVTGVDHKLNKNDWETIISTTLIPTTDNVSKITGSLKFSLQEEVTPVVPENVSKTPSANNQTVRPVTGNQLLATVLKDAGYTPGTFLYEWALIQGTIEGYGPARTIATRQNNPGNLRGANYPNLDPGATKVGGFAKFSTKELGAKAMVQFFLIKWSNGDYPGTLTNGPGNDSKAYRLKYNVPASLDIAGKKINVTAEQFYYIYAPPSDNNDTELYINTVVKSLQKKFPGFTRYEKLINWINK